MYMDWNSGSKTISHRRSWRYGRAWAQLMSLHPERRVRMLKERPECTVYSGILLSAPMALAGVFKRRNRFITIGWLAALVGLLIKNRKEVNSRAVIVDHAIGAAAFMSEALVQVAGELPPVLLAFDTDSPCVLDLEEAIREQGVPLRRVSGPTSSTINLILGPLMLVFARVRGARVLHLHWTYCSTSNSEVLGHPARVWLKLFWKIAQKVGIKVVWTALNISPNELASSDDVPAHYDLVSSRNAVMNAPRRLPAWPRRSSVPTAPT